MPSIREQVAINLADFLVFSGIHEDYKIRCEKVGGDGKSCWQIIFQKTGQYNGTLKVFQPNTIQMTWIEKNGANRGKDTGTAKSEYEVKEFLMKKFMLK